MMMEDVPKSRRRPRGSNGTVTVTSITSAFINSSSSSSSSSSVPLSRKYQQWRRISGLIVLVFAGIWSWMLYHAHSSVMSLRSSLQQRGSVGLMLGPQLLQTRKGADVAAVAAAASITAPVKNRADVSHQAINSNTADNQKKNPYFGWQPPIPSERACSWRECFKKQHDGCVSCRDLPQDLEPLPTMVDNDWIPDVTMLYRMRLQGHDSNGNPWPPLLDDELCEPIGGTGGNHDDNKQLLDAVPVQVRPLTPTESQSLPKIMCMIYTMQENHATNIRAMRETWASHCDGFLAFSTAHDPRLPAISLPHDGKEEYNNMWQKVRSIWKFVGKHYLDDFDFFFQGGEDLFVIPQNLKRYLGQLLDKDGQTSDDDYFVGRRFKGYGDNNYFNSGGAGYALSRGTLRKYLQVGYNHSKCNPTKHSAMEDVMIAQCLRTVFGIGLTDTRDDELRERFHPFAPATHYFWKPPQTDGKNNRDWYEDYNQEWPPMLGEMCCAPDSVSFHYIKKPAMTRHLYALLNTCAEDDEEHAE